MYRLLLVYLNVLAYLLVSSPSGLAQHYYSDGQKTPLAIDSAVLCVKFDSLLTEVDRSALVEQVAGITHILADEPLMHGFVACSLSKSAEYGSVLNEARRLPGVIRRKL